MAHRTVARLVAFCANSGCPILDASRTSLRRLCGTPKLTVSRMPDLTRYPNDSSPLQKVRYRLSLARPGTFSIITEIGFIDRVIRRTSKIKSLRRSRFFRVPFLVRIVEKPWHGGQAASRLSSPGCRFRALIMSGPDRCLTSTSQSLTRLWLSL